MRKNTIKINNTIYQVGKTEVSAFTGNCRSIYQVYGRPSYRKQSIWYKIQSICDKLNGRNLTVTSYNCMFFSCCFEFTHNRKKYQMSFTPSHWYMVNRITK